jgi:hypothetical protein
MDDLECANQEIYKLEKQLEQLIKFIEQLKHMPFRYTSDQIEFDKFRL